LSSSLEKDLAQTKELETQLEFAREKNKRSENNIQNYEK